MKVAWYNTASLIVSDDSAKLLIDPFYTYNVDRQAMQNAYAPLYRSCDAVLLTHGHFDHAHDVPDIVKGTDMKIYCTRSPQKRLLQRGVEAERIHCFAPRDSFTIGGFEIKIHKAAHGKFGLPLVLHTAKQKRLWAHTLTAMKIGLSAVFTEKEAKETVIIEIIGSDKKSVVIVGSMGIDENTVYPSGADLLVLPYQGRSNLVEYGLNMLALFKPKKVLLDHYNDYAPPISSLVDYTDFRHAANEKYPHIDIIALKIGESITVE